jgi:hypothetical protein
MIYCGILSGYKYIPLIQYYTVIYLVGTSIYLYLEGTSILALPNAFHAYCHLWIYYLMGTFMI